METRTKADEPAPNRRPRTLSSSAVGKKLAVLLMHGILNSDERDFAETGVRLLKNAFSATTGMDADDALVIKPAPWGQVSQPYEDRLLRRLGGGERGKWFYDWL